MFEIERRYPNKWWSFQIECLLLPKKCHASDFAMMDIFLHAVFYIPMYLLIVMEVSIAFLSVLIHFCEKYMETHRNEIVVSNSDTDSFIFGGIILLLFVGFCFDRMIASN